MPKRLLKPRDSEMLLHKGPNPALAADDTKTPKEQTTGPNIYPPGTTFSVQRALENVDFIMYYYTLNAQFFHNSRSPNLPTTTSSHSHKQFLGSSLSQNVSCSCPQLFPLGQIYRRGQYLT